MAEQRIYLPQSARMLLLVLALFSTCCTAQVCDSGDAAALIAFKDTFVDPAKFFKQWVAERDCCGWPGVRCTSAGRVERLTVVAGVKRRDNYDGIVGSTLGDLSALKSLDFNGVFFEGPIPDSLGKLKRLESLSLINGNFNGSIPASIGLATNLRRLVINLVGHGETMATPAPLPTALCDLHKLEYVDLSHSRLTGAIPECLCQWTEITSLRLTDNSLGGDMPDCVGDKLQNLLHLDLSSNNFTGQIPPTLGGLNQLVDLHLGNNTFSDVIPEELGDLRNLEGMYLQNNGLSGAIPASFERLTALEYLDLSRNHLSRIPAQLKNLHRLKRFDVSRNRLSGILDPELGSIGSGIQGKFVLDISNNRFTGPIPSTFQHCFRFTAHSNEFSGGFPRELTNILFVDLSNNLLSDLSPQGKAPVRPMIEELRLSNNKLSGPIPAWLVAVWTQSVYFGSLDISLNNFNGSIPQSIFELPQLLLFNASYNSFESTLPTLGSFTVLSPYTFTLDLSHNKLSGQIPSTFLAEMMNAYILDLSFNNFGGWIPGDINWLVNAAVVNLSNNKLIGRVPKRILELPELQLLDLSKNRLIEPVPSKEPEKGFVSDSF